MDLSELIILYSLVLMLPATMVLFGLIFMYRPPKSINWTYGYRTRGSTGSQEAWDFAHAHFGRLWTYLGAAMLPASIAATVLMQGTNIWTAVLILLIIQTAIMMAPIMLTEWALKNRIDDQLNL